MTQERKHSPLHERLYSYNPSGYCGVVMPEKVMKKLVKLTADFEAEVRRILTENKDDLRLYEWGLAYPNGKQQTVVFSPRTDFGGGIEGRIKLFKARQPEYLPEVYGVGAYGPEAKEVIAQIEALAEAEYA